MLIKNALIENNEKTQDLRIENGVFTQIGELKENPDE